MNFQLSDYVSLYSFTLYTSKTMKKIDMKSLLLGGTITALAIVLMSNSQQEYTPDLFVSGHPAGIAIYNPETMLIFRHDMFA